MWIKMDEILERGLSFILLHCSVFIHIQAIFNKKSPGPLINKVPKAFNTTLCRVPRLTRVELFSIKKPYYISIHSTFIIN
ncbi:hypothetical protein BTTOUR_29060 [Bacillus thuringiensis serovar toumanoffi]|uniref:Uncharacterized protein n=1 Tax=Bacillus thuringiensis serovar toumanoffi TaxID=180862 RepID=A0ABD5I6Z9_BACTU|nr:hypothetical protein [Bacillus thuringiensis serovar toumanoffi]OTZ56667.1 hypothetical protein BK762_02135 [Bacillus thuringiensis serovar toumanoffi]